MQITKSLASKIYTDAAELLLSRDIWDEYVEDYACIAVHRVIDDLGETYHEREYLRNTLIDEFSYWFNPMKKDCGISWFGLSKIYDNRLRRVNALLLMAQCHRFE